MTSSQRDKAIPRVSVIMNVRNGEAALREAIDSVLAQTFEGWELIFWDDQSTDGSAALFHTYDDPRFRYFLSEDLTHVGAARDRAIRVARGEWLGLLDQDDIWLPDKLEKQMRIADADSQAAIIYGRAVTFTPDGKTREYDRYHEFETLPEGNIFERLFIDSSFIPASALMMRRSAVLDLGPMPAEVRISPDYYWVTALARKYPARAVQEVVTRYRLHEGNMSKSLRREMQLEILWLIDRWKDALAPHIVRRRLRIHQTIVAYVELCRPGTFVHGLVRLLTRGSILYMLQQAIARPYRAVKRRVITPEWQKPPASNESRCPRRVSILGTEVTATTFEQARRRVAELVERHTPGYVSPANVYSVTLAYERPDYRRSLNDATLVTPDGVPIVVALRFLGFHAERVHNDDLFLACCAEYRHWRHFLVGGRKGQPEDVAEELRRRFPFIQVVGPHATPARPLPESETKRILEKINAAQPSVVWVGMGTPAQDEWMTLVAKRVAAPMVAVGSAFDLLTGRTRPTPEWAKRTGLQWLFRLAQEPKRLGPRYLYYNPRFLVAFCAQMARQTLGRHR